MSNLYHDIRPFTPATANGLVYTTLPTTSVTPPILTLSTDETTATEERLETEEPPVFLQRDRPETTNPWRPLAKQINSQLRRLDPSFYVLVTLVACILLAGLTLCVALVCCGRTAGCIRCCRGPRGRQSATPTETVAPPAAPEAVQKPEVVPRLSLIHI